MNLTPVDICIIDLLFALICFYLYKELLLVKYLYYAIFSTGLAFYQVIVCKMGYFGL